MDRPSKLVILAEDTPFMSERMRQTFVQSGYVKLEVHSDGEEAWKAMTSPGAPIDAVVSDIEMPRADGLHLCKRIKDDAKLRGVPALLFSLLISNDNAK